MTVPAQVWLWLLIGLPGGAGAALLLGAVRTPGGDRRAAPIALSVSAVVVALSILTAVTRPAVGVAFMAGTEFGLRVDALSATVVPAVAVVTFLVLVFAAGDAELAGGRFHGLMLVFASSALLTMTAATLPALLLAWEVMGAVSYALIGYHWRDQYRVSSGLTAFITTRTADVGLYLAAGAALAGGAGLALTDLVDASPGWRHVLAFGVLLAALGKAAQLPFSFWLSRAMQGPSPVSALLHSAAMVAMGAYLLLRTAPLLAATGWAATAAASLGMVTAVLLGAVAVAQRDLKQLLAASTAAQLGFVVMASGLAAVAGGAAHLVAHAFTKAGLFLAAGAWLALLGTKDLNQLHGVARRSPALGVPASIAALALAGVAPLSLWATKEAVLSAALAHSLWLYTGGLVAAALSAAYAGKILLFIWHPPTDAAEALSPQTRRESRALNWFERAPLVFLAAGAAVAGVLALPPIGPWLNRALDGSLTAHPNAAELTASAALAAGVVVAVLRWGLPEPRWAAAWLGLERAMQVVCVRPTMRAAHGLARFDDYVLDRATRAVLAHPTLVLARVLARFDDRVLDGAVDRAATDSVRVAEWTSRIDIGGVDAVVEAVGAWMRRLGELARKPQTGQLHHYYRAAVVLFFLGVVLLVAAR